MGTSMLDAYLDLGFLNEQQRTKINTKNKARFTESSSGALVEILDLLSVNSLSKTVDVNYLAILLCQFMTYKFTDSLKIDYDGHFTEKDFNTDDHLSGPGSLALKTFKLREERILRCGPFFDDPALRTDNSNQVDSQIHDLISKIGVKRNYKRVSSEENADKNDTEMFRNGKTRLLKECVNSIQAYRVFVKNEMRKLCHVPNDTMNVENSIQDQVAMKIYKSFKRKNTLNSVIHSRFIRLGNPDIMTYVLNFMQSLVIQTTSNERSFSVFRFVKGNYKNNINNDLFEAYLHMSMWNSVRKKNDFFNTLNKGVEIRTLRDMHYKINSFTGTENQSDQSVQTSQLDNGTITNAPNIQASQTVYHNNGTIINAPNIQVSQTVYHNNGTITNAPNIQASQTINHNSGTITNAPNIEASQTINHINGTISNDLNSEVNQS
ncbi:hypothetical protein HANVADRAFT_63964 [Hanseniaspora valbyensis NRRL Y-1626]|uniref:Uncharacterized protein n=1 Tax=Hanseniaspora valbyensis NRRL Y-1626 TaxID=766949 RepID=A0A1B7T8D9_9ASCO|nr:hypothetical protein HANVADRAFT_63964 [Hanseniaspora valbyensis NRRL Y-1626]